MTVSLTSHVVTYVRIPRANDDGATIFDDRVITSLKALGVTVREIEANRIGRATSICEAGKRASSPTLYRYNLTSDQYSEIPTGSLVIVSHEELSLIVERLCSIGNVFFLMHNSPGAFFDFRSNSLRGLIRPLARRAEKQFIRHPRVTAIVLSKREQRILQGYKPARQIRLLQPGAPKVAEMSPRIEQPLQMTISGSYAWAYKRRDTEWFMKEVLAKLSAGSGGLGTLFADDRFATYYPNVKNERDMPVDGTIRLGVVPDRFVTGFKLKAIWYIANYCAIATASDLSDEFIGIPYASDFIRHFRSFSDFSEILSDMRNIDIEKFVKFREAILSEFNWKKQVSAAFLDA